MNRLYTVSFDTQRNRVYKNWEYITAAGSKKEAIEQARAAWNSTEGRPHMFHCCAERIDAAPDGRELNRFKCIDWTPVHWGRR